MGHTNMAGEYNGTC